MNWPDWSGRTVAVVASGPSSKKANLDVLRGRVVGFAVKESVNLMPWAEAVYGCDAAWWVFRKGLPEFAGWKFTFSENVGVDFDGITKVKIDRHLDRMLFAETGKVGAGGNSGFQALNLAAQFGATKVILVGFDMNDQNCTHWYGRNNWHNAGNPSEWNFRRWRRAFDMAANQLKERGIRVINCSPMTSLTAFPVMSIESAMEE